MERRPRRARTRAPARRRPAVRAGRRAGRPGRGVPRGAVGLDTCLGAGAGAGPRACVGIGGLVAVRAVVRAVVRGGHVVRVRRVRGVGGVRRASGHPRRTMCRCRCRCRFPRGGRGRRWRNPRPYRRLPSSSFRPEEAEPASVPESSPLPRARRSPARGRPGRTASWRRSPHRHRRTDPDPPPRRTRPGVRRLSERQARPDRQPERPSPEQPTRPPAHGRLDGAPGAGVFAGGAGGAGAQLGRNRPGAAARARTPAPRAAAEAAPSGSRLPPTSPPPRSACTRREGCSRWELTRHLGGIRVGRLVDGRVPSAAGLVPIAVHYASWCGRAPLCRGGVGGDRSHGPGTPGSPPCDAHNPLAGFFSPRPTHPNRHRANSGRPYRHGNRTPPGPPAAHRRTE
ncbi:hypothetical protein SMICM304S_03217 [Streptomyces microflavus]